MTNKAHKMTYNPLSSQDQCGGSMNEDDAAKNDLNGIFDDFSVMRLKTCPKCHEEKHVWDYPARIRECKECYNAESKLKRIKTHGHPLSVIDKGYSFWHRRK